MLRPHIGFRTVCVSFRVDALLSETVRNSHYNSEAKQQGNKQRERRNMNPENPESYIVGRY